MTAGEDQPQAVVLDAVVAILFRAATCLDALGQCGERSVKPRAASDRVDRLESTGGHEPRPRIGRNAVPLPLLRGSSKRIMQRLFRQIEIAKDANQCGEHAPRFGAVNVVDQCPDFVRVVLSHGWTLPLETEV